MGFGSGGGSEFTAGRNDLDGDLTVTGKVTVSEISTDGTLKLSSNTITLGTGADTDIALNFDANSNDGTIKWFEDEKSFQLVNRVTIGVAPSTATNHKGELTTLSQMDSSSAKYTTQYSANFDMGGFVISIGSTPTVQGGLYYLGYAGGWEAAHSANPKSAKGLVAIALGGNSSTHAMFTKGFIRMPAAAIDGPIGNAGAPLYISSASAGKMHFTGTAVDGDFRRTVGYCVDRNGTTDILLYFDPAGAFESIVG